MWWDIVKSKLMGQMSDGKKELLEHKPKVKIDIPKMSYPDDRKEVKEVIKIMKEKPVPEDIMSRHDKDSDQVLFDIVDAKSSDYEDFIKHGLKEKEAKKRAKEATKGVIDSIKWLDDMDCVIVVLDSTKDPYSQVNITIVGNLIARDIPVLIVGNKIDLRSSLPARFSDHQ